MKVIYRPYIRRLAQLLGVREAKRRLKDAGVSASTVRNMYLYSGYEPYTRVGEIVRDVYDVAFAECQYVLALNAGK